MRVSLLRLLPFVILACVGCTSSEPVGDGTSVDAGPIDAGHRDAGDSDGSTVDAEVADADVADADVPDADVVDADVPDADVPDAMTPSCVGFPCDANEVCTTASGSPACVCAAGHQDHDGDGTCARGCEASSCHGHGTCDDTTGEASCACTGGYQGPDCAACAAGHQDHDDDGTCAADCSAVVCDGDHEGCEDDDGTAACDCLEGYVRDAASECVATCAVTECGANNVCDDADGTPACSCAPGTSDPDEDGDCSPPCRSGNTTIDAGPGAPYELPWYAIDGSTSTGTILDGVVSYLTFDHGEGVSPVVRSFLLYGNGYSATAEFGYELQGSHDGSTWVTLGAHRSTLVYVLPRRVSFENEIGYRYYRFVLTDRADGGMAVMEIELNTCP